MKFDLKQLNLKDKNTWLVLGLVGVLLLVIAMPVERAEKQGEKTVLMEASSEKAEKQTVENDEDTATEALERRLEEVLSLIDGAGKVRVMITLKDTGEKVVEKDTTRRTDSNATGTQGQDMTSSSVYERDGSVETPYISNELTPQVEGVLVVAQGGGNSLVKQHLLQSVMALFPLEAHKITIVKMSMQEVSDHENF